MSPNSLDVLLHAFDNMIIYFHSKENPEDLESIMNEYETVKQKIKSEFPDDHALFGYVNMSSDTQNVLGRFGK